MPDNAWYVEGSHLDRFLEGRVQLEGVYQNRILVVANPPLKAETINAVSAARATEGVDAKILELKVPLRMIARIEEGRATGDVFGWKELVAQVSSRDFDALAIHTPITVNRDMALSYYREGGVNPWGGVEAKASRLIATELNLPVAHAPLEDVNADDEELFFIFNEVVDPRIAPEVISNCYLHSVLVGLNEAPAIGRGLSVHDVDFMVSPAGCVGRPHEACLEAGIPVIIVKENETIYKERMPSGFIEVENYWEAAGIIMSRRAGITPMSVRRPLAYTDILDQVKA
jgi:hypothetical protein